MKPIILLSANVIFINSLRSEHTKHIVIETNCRDSDINVEQKKNCDSTYIFMKL